jgi:hypothetical protein
MVYFEKCMAQAEKKPDSDSCSAGQKIPPFPWNLSAPLTLYCSGDNNENEMGEACSAYGERRIHGFARETGGKDTTWKTQT